MLLAEMLYESILQQSRFGKDSGCSNTTTWMMVFRASVTIGRCNSDVSDATAEVANMDFA